MKTLSQAFYGILTPLEVSSIVWETCKARDLLILYESKGQVLVASSASDIVKRKQSVIRNRIYIVCTEVSMEELESIDPAPCLILDHPIIGESKIEQTWLSYKLSESECADKLRLCFQAIVRSFRKNLLGHTQGYFPHDPKSRSQYPRIKYSKMALDCFLNGTSWRDGSVVLEPSTK